MIRTVYSYGLSSGTKLIISITMYLSDSRINWASLSYSLELISLSAGHEIDNPSDEESKKDHLAYIDAEDDEDLPVFLWRPGQTTDALGSWEKHTKVIKW